MNKFFTNFASRTASFSGSSTAFVVALGTIIVWAASGPLFEFSEVWQLVINTGTTIVTFLMIFLVQNSQNRDSAAMEAKLDELLRAVEQARADFIGIEHLTEEEIEDIRARLEKENGPEGEKPSPYHAMTRLLSRR
ncbi:low affinity Fe/Cu permease [Agrobacterium tumefaciens]|jgi:low affinity Fe/Cu permease|uniref:Low affinity Fe/Cu permease n=1 Tax=Agrobacterium radiobacter TaxID=362 RepID=A0ABR6JBU5_AGRRD|nr:MULTISPECIES: low affinity iron permease family protein [Agrobacterium tumefaciens complex]MBB4320687.1 low affinity Fe/Cu permease [Agrobacterium radiobacter]MBB4337351.1 low affinity Fe/Cu permease [Agrobacterium radiobacter]MBB4492400.1 low affinity Fe/Cu permease [Agrobacterium radiobacter]MBB4497299.1 low affinity Fe/Cu permease [Agrobacterium radiobacter]MBB4502791.1 low affinity Fe/Cu permease [Agrobacterium radiobacter]